jgi:gamma-butyrobetaine dioxygenase
MATAPLAALGSPPLTPDFIDHRWCPLDAARLDSGFVHVSWPDGTAFDAYALWLAENADGYGLEPSSRESMLEPRDLPSPDDLRRASVDDDGALALDWIGDRRTRVHPGWLRHVADGRHRPSDPLPDQVAWTAADMAEPPTLDGSDVLDDDEVFTEWLTLQIRHGLCRLTGTPTDPGFVGELVSRIGPIRDTNFGPV